MADSGGHNTGITPAARRSRDARPRRDDRDITPPRARPTSDVDPAHLPPEVTFEGDDTTCSICCEPYTHGQRVVRLVCRHVFHLHCWAHYLASVPEFAAACCNCRGSARIIARCVFISSPEHRGTSGSELDFSSAMNPPHPPCSWTPSSPTRKEKPTCQEPS